MNDPFLIIAETFCLPIVSLILSFFIARFTYRLFKSKRAEGARKIEIAVLLIISIITGTYFVTTLLGFVLMIATMI